MPAKASAANAAAPQPAPDPTAAAAPADQVATPPTDAAPETPAEAAPQAEPAVTGRWEYISDEPLIYTNVPVTPQRGDVVEWVDVPPADDGRWKPTDKPVTRQPDNAPKEG